MKELIGVMVKPLEIISGTTKDGKAWEKGLLVLEEKGQQYDNEHQLSAWGDVLNNLKEVEVGSTIDIKFLLKTRKWKKDEATPVKYFTDLDIESFSVTGKSEIQRNTPVSTGNTQADEFLAQKPDEDDGALPF